MRFRFDLRWIMLVIICLSVGLAIGRLPVDVEDEEVLPGWSFHTPQLHWAISILATVTIAFLIGMWQQCRLLWIRLQDLNSEEELSRVSFWFAMGWRAAVAGGLAACLIGQALLESGAVRFEEISDWTVYDGLFPEYTWMLLLLVVLSAIPKRTRTKKQTRSRRLSNAVAWILGIVLASLILPEVTLVPLLVHLATAGYDAASNLSDGKAFPNHLMEGYRVFWTAFLAAFVVVANLVQLWWISRREFKSRRGALFSWSLLGLGVLFAACYCYWFHQHEYARISPYLALARCNSLPRQWLAGGVLVLIAVTSGAYRLAIAGPSSSIFQVRSERSFFHLSPLWAMLLLLAIVLNLKEVLAMLYSLTGFLSPGLLSEWLVFSLQWLPNYFQLAVLVLTISLLWKYLWRYDLLSTIVVREIHPVRFIRYWLTLLLVMLTGIPVLAIFCFALWLGPWYGWPIPAWGTPWF